MDAVDRYGKRFIYYFTIDYRLSETKKQLWEAIKDSTCR